MKVVTLMFDTLRRDVLPQYGGDLELPNFKRLEKKTITFDNFYAGSLPCMPARREMLTGIPNFLHRGWSPIEPFDICFPEILKRNGVYTHLITDHQHYWEDGGATYHNRYSSYEFVRGQEGDLYKAIVNTPSSILDKFKRLGIEHPHKRNMIKHDEVNRMYMQEEQDYPQANCVKLGLEFLEENYKADNWYLQVECFDPHEPFYVPDRFKDMVDEKLKYSDYDWPNYESTRNISINKVSDEFKNYKALLLMIDEYLGKFLDFFDNNNMWDDTVLILNTDHGFMFGEKEWSGKSCMPVYNEIAHTPFALHIPGYNENGHHVDCIAQTYDIAETMYDLFEINLNTKTFGTSLKELLRNDDREYGLTGYFGGHLNVFDKEYSYMRGSATVDNMPLEEYTLMPMRMRKIFGKTDFENVQLVDGFSMFKGWKVMKVDSKEMFYSPFASGNMLFNTKEDKLQENNILDDALEEKYISVCKMFLDKLEAPKSQYKRLGLDSSTNVIREREKRSEVLLKINEGIPSEILDRDIQATVINLSLIGRKDFILECVENKLYTSTEMRLYAKENYPDEEELIYFIQ